MLSKLDEDSRRALLSAVAVIVVLTTCATISWGLLAFADRLREHAPEALPGADVGVQTQDEP